MPGPASSSGGDDQKWLNLVLRLAAMAAVMVWSFLVIQPFLPIILWATILAIGLHPIFLWLKQVLGQRSTLAASVLAIVGIGVIVGPVAFLVINLFDDVKRLAEAIGSGTVKLPPVPPGLEQIPLFGVGLAEAWQTARTDLGALLQQFQPQLESTAKFLLSLGADTGLAILQLLVAMVVATIFILNTGPLCKRIALTIRQLAPTKTEQLMTLATSTLQHVIRGVIGVAAVQSGLIGVGLVLAGIPWAGMLTLVCFILALLQIGPTLVVLPVLIFAWMTMNKLVALLLTIWLIPAGLIDNVLKPIWMARGLPVPLVVVLLGVIGGTISFGLVGLFTGPVILTLSYDLLRIWARDGEIVETT